MLIPNSQYDGAYYYAEKAKRDEADKVRRATGKDEYNTTLLGVFCLFFIPAVIGAIIGIYNYVMFHLSAVFSVLQSYILSL